MSPAKRQPSRHVTAGPHGKADARTPALLPIRVKSSNSAPLYDQVRQAVRQQITSGKLVPGQRLPSMRKLCAELNIAYATVARAIRQLVEEGVLEAKTGRGTRVALRRTGRLQTIGVLGQAGYKHFTRDSRYYNRLLQLIQEELLDRDQVVAYGRWPADVPVNQLFNKLQQIDGLVICKLTPQQLKQIPIAQRMGVPVIMVGRTFDPVLLPSVDSDNFNDSRRLTEALIRHGHRRIAFLQESVEHDLRITGYQAAMQAAGLPAPDAWRLSDRHQQWGEKLLKLSSAPTAAIISGATAFTTLHESLQGTALEPGNGLDIGIYDENLWQVVSPLKIPHWRVDQPLEKIAGVAVNELMKMLADKHYHPANQLLASTIYKVDAQGHAREVPADQGV